MSVACWTCAGTGRRPGATEWLEKVNVHARALIGTCWRLGALPQFAGLNPRRWAHMLGFRGHFTTKSRSYSTTFGALRAERATYQAD